MTSKTTFTYTPGQPDRWPDYAPTHCDLPRTLWWTFARAALAAGKLSDWEVQFIRSVVNTRRRLTPKQAGVLDRIIEKGWVYDPALWDEVDAGEPPVREVCIPDGTFRVNNDRETVEVVKTSLGAIDFGDDDDLE